MALHPDERQAVDRAIQAQVPTFLTTTWNVILAILKLIIGPADGRTPAKLPADLAALRGGRFAPGDGDLVILRQRLLWAMADTMTARLPGLPATWTAAATGQALQVVGPRDDGGVVRCGRPATSVAVVDALVQDYAALAVDGLNQSISVWIERVAADIVQALRLRPAQFADVRHLLDAEPTTMLRRIFLQPAHGEVGVRPEEIRMHPWSGGPSPQLPQLPQQQPGQPGQPLSKKQRKRLEWEERQRQQQ